MPHASTNGIETFYRVVGEGFPVLFIHGGLGGVASFLSGEIHDDLFGRRSPYLLICYERRGCGRKTSPSDSGYDLKTFAMDAKALLDHLDFQRVHLMGSSAGGPIAIRFAIDFPQMVESLVLVNTAPSLIPEDDLTLRIRKLVESLNRDGSEILYQRRPSDAQLDLAELWERPNAARLGKLNWYEQRHQERLKTMESMSLQERACRYCAAFRMHDAYDHVDLTGELSRITAPTLIMHGARDLDIPIEGAHTLFRNIPTSEMHLFADLEHGLLSRERKEEVVDVILDFLGRIDRRKPIGEGVK